MEVYMFIKRMVYLPGTALDIVHCSKSAWPTFTLKEHYLEYRNYLSDACDHFKVDLHAYILMEDYVRLLMTPRYEDSISCLMESLGRRYQKYYNQAHSCVENEWEGQYSVSEIGIKNILHCYQQIEQEPLVSGMIVHPIEYRWSSYRYNAYGKMDRLLTPHWKYLELSRDLYSRLKHYREQFDAIIKNYHVQRENEGKALKWGLKQPPRQGRRAFVSGID